MRSSKFSAALIAASMAGTVLLAGCGSPDANETDPAEVRRTDNATPTPQGDEQQKEAASATPSPSDLPTVDWDNYDDGLQQKIDGYTEAKNCDGITGEIQKAKGASGQADLIGYLEASGAAAGCT
ncbi:hypothetical protein [Solicola sp. PLA-1-18]|uniref:hypothetical protein n=1 Tax=Solicola sp. PLA-1-18 TaxID=3380532 RepID=UPI003B7D1AF4